MPHFIVLHFIEVNRCCFFFFFPQIDGKTLHQQGDYNVLYFDTPSIVMVRNQTCNISEKCLYCVPMALLREYKEEKQCYCPQMFSSLVGRQSC